MSLTEQPLPPQARLVPFPGPRQSRPGGNLPLALTSLVGRDGDADGVDRTLERSRLVTLTGPGGVGKTRLALEVGRRRQGTYPDGVWLVDLSPLTDAALVVRAVADVLGISESPERPLIETLTEALSGRSLLLIVDNCEHLVDAAARLVESLLGTAPCVSVLATSREAMAIDGEAVWPVSPLASPPDDSAPLAAHLALLPSVRLFVDRASSVAAGFRLTDQNAPAVAQICRRLDGLPLALELAAARVSSLTVGQIAARLDDRFRLLITGRRTAPPRQQTLQATLDWSFALLNEDERAALSRVTVFVNGWTLAAAERVLSDDGRGVSDDLDSAGDSQRATRNSQLAILDALGRLVARSLVRFDQFEQGGPAPAPEPRYRLLETVREYAWERLKERGEVEAIRRRHAEWCAELAEQAEPGLLGHEQIVWFVRLDQELDNLRSALGWCLEHDPSLGLRIAASLWQFWRVRLYLSEGRHWLDSLLARAPVSTVTRARALIGSGLLAHWQLDSATASAQFEACLALARAAGDDQLAGRALRELGTLAAFRSGDHQRAWDHFAEGLALSQAAGDRRSVATNLMQQGRLAAAEGDYRRARELLDQSVALLSEVGDRWQLAMTLEDAGGVALVCGEPERAMALFEEAIATAEVIEAAGLGKLHRRYHPGSVAYWRGDAESAVAWYEHGLALTRESEHAAGIADNLAGLGRAVLLLGDVDQATTLLQESLRLFDDRASSSGAGLALHGLGLAAWQAGDGTLALARLRESLHLRQRLAERPGIAECLEALARVTLARASGPDDARRAMRWLGAADALRERIGVPRPPVDQPAYDESIEAAAVWLDDLASDALAGAGLLLDTVIADALSERPIAVAPSGPPPAVSPPASISAPTAAPGPTPDRPIPASLSARELDVLRLIAAGRTNVEIAEILVVSANTVRHHVTHILDKTGCENRAAATAFALRHNLV